MTTGSNPLLNLAYEPVLENLGDDYYDVVAAAEFPSHFLRYRNDRLLPLLGLKPETVTDGDFVAAFGKFEGVRPFLALRYHGYQFGAYNPFLGDGRGFLYGQVQGVDGNLYDLGTKGSGRTPYSRTADGRLTLKGGVREVLAGEALHQLGVNTSRCLSLIETGESLWRGDEPSPTRSSVMVRLSKTHIRFGTLERLHYLERPDLIRKLVDSAIAVYYPDISDHENKYEQFYGQLVVRVAQLAAQWMAAGFCHGVLNTDNMSIAGESFDYGPYAFIPTYNARFTAASFDYGGRYSYGNQPYICKFNLELLQKPLAMITEQSVLEVGLTQFDEAYQQHYQQLMLQKLGLDTATISASETSSQQKMGVLTANQDLLAQTVTLLRDSEIGYHGFFAELAQQFSPQWRENKSSILSNATFAPQVTENWRKAYHKCLNLTAPSAMTEIGDRLQAHNPQTALLSPLIESVWQSISEDNDWQPFASLVAKLQQ
ncbi:MAG: YdiU family protein [Cyanobacteria bacterium J06629_2]